MLSENMKNIAVSAYCNNRGSRDTSIWAAVEAVLAEQARATEQGQAGCDNASGYPLHVPQMTNAPAGDVVERMYEAFDDEGGTSNYRKGMAAALAVAREGYVPIAELEEERKKHKEQGQVACELFDEVKRLQGEREGYVSLEDVEKAVYAEVSTIPSFGDTASSSFVAHVRARLAKPAEQTDEQKVEAIVKRFGMCREDAYPSLAAEIVAALKAGKQ